jgi:hypothetical protein
MLNEKMMTAADWIVVGAAVYACIGVLFGIAFVIRGAGAIDPAAKHAGLSFRVLILPGAAALWPLLLHRWMRI